MAKNTGFIFMLSYILPGPCKMYNTNVIIYFIFHIKSKRKIKLWPKINSGAAAKVTSTI